MRLGGPFCRSGPDGPWEKTRISPVAEPTYPIFGSRPTLRARRAAHHVMRRVSWRRSHPAPAGPIPSPNFEDRMDLNRFVFRSVGLTALAALVALGGCVSVQDRVRKQEDNLSAAGFIVKPANTPRRQDMLARLPPNRIIQRIHDDTVHYVYADPTVCKCLYIGTQSAYAAFKREEQQQHLADEQLMTAQMYSDPAWSWGAWGPWGPGFGFVYGPYGW